MKIHFGRFDFSQKTFLTAFILAGGFWLFGCEKKEDSEESPAEVPVAVVQSQDQPPNENDSAQGGVQVGSGTIIGTNAAPVTTAHNENMTAEGESLLTLSYTDSDGDKATSCSVDELHLVTISTACNCAAGVCKVGLVHNFPYVDNWGYIHYTVTAGGTVSNRSKITLASSCPAVGMLAGASLVADSGSCPDYSSWTGTVNAGDILILQEGGPTVGDNGGVIKAFDANGCYKGAASTEESPGYAVGLKVESYGNSIDVHNFTKILTATRVNGGNNPGVYEWNGPYTSGAQTAVTLGTSGAGTNPAKVPDDDSDTFGDAQLTNIGTAPISMRYVATNRYPIGANGDGSPKFVRLVADNSAKTIRAYIDGVEKTECAVSIGAPTSCSNCSTNALADTREVTDIHLSPGAWSWDKATYVWTETRTINGLPRSYWGVSQMNICRDTITSFADLGHTDLFENDELSTSGVKTNAVLETKSPGAGIMHNVIFAGVAGSYSDFLVAKYTKDLEGTYNRVCTNLAGTARAMNQDVFQSSSLFPSWRSLYTVETDSQGTHLRKYSMSGDDQGKLEKTLYTETTPTVFNASWSVGSWIVVVPAVAPPGG